MKMNGTPTIEPSQMADELARLELEVRPGDVAGQVRAEVALLDEPVQAGQGHALSQDVAEAAPGRTGRGDRLGFAGGVALEAGADARSRGRRWPGP